MAALNESLTELQDAVDAVAVRLNAFLIPLQTALTDAQTRVAALELEDTAQRDELTRLLAEADSAAAIVRGQVTELNAIGANPAEPVQEVAVEDLPPAPTAPADAPTTDTPAAPPAAADTSADAPADVAVPDIQAPSDAPVATDAAPTDAPADASADAPTDAAAPADAPTPEGAPAAPTDPAAATDAPTNEAPISDPAAPSS